MLLHDRAACTRHCGPRSSRKASASSRLASLGVGYLCSFHAPAVIPQLSALGLLILAGKLHVGGNLFFLRR